MNKSKFKTVKFKPTDRYLTPDFSMSWHDITYQFKVSFTEDYINLHPELFEVEKAQREFEEGACYKAKYVNGSVWEVIKYMYGGFYRISSNQKYTKERFFEIGEKIEL